MEQTEAISRLAELREELRMAAEEQDWKDIALIDQDILAIGNAFPRERRSAELVSQFALMRETYQQVIAQGEARRDELRGKMQGLRSQRGAIAGYQNTLAASQSGSRGSHDAR